jgi:transcriptional regulator with XRE-family HTH domain
MAKVARRNRIPRHIHELPLGERLRWARKSAGLSHDRLVEKLGRSNRGHLIKIERGQHTPRRDLRDAIADATGVPRELFHVDDDEEDRSALTVAIDQLLRQRIDELFRERERAENGRA